MNAAAPSVAPSSRLAFEAFTESKPVTAGLRLIEGQVPLAEVSCGVAGALENRAHEGNRRASISLVSLVWTPVSTG